MRFKMIAILIGVAVIALDFELIREAQRLTIARGAHDDGLFLFSAYVFIPSLSLLAVSAIYSGIGLVKYGKASAFSTGYVLLGGLASFGISLDLASQSFILNAMTTVADFLQSRFFHQDIDELPTTFYLFHELFIDILAILVFALIQMACGLIGGGLASRFGLTIVLSSRTVPAAVPVAVTNKIPENPNGPGLE